MNLGQAKSLVRLLYSQATGENDIDDIQINAVLDVVNKAAWMDAVRGHASLFATDSADLGLTNGSYDYSALNAFQIIDIAWKYSGEYFSLDYVILHDRSQYNLGIGTTTNTPSAYTLHGETVHVLPATGSNPVTIRITYIPELGDWSSDSAEAINSKLTQFHPMIPYEAALSLIPEDRSGNVKAVASRYRSLFEEHLQSRQRGTGRSIRHVPYE